MLCRQIIKNGNGFESGGTIAPDGNGFYSYCGRPIQRTDPRSPLPRA